LKATGEPAFRQAARDAVEIYQAIALGSPVALSWYYPHIAASGRFYPEAEFFFVLPTYASPT
jgi:hypothetical protein